MFNENNQNIKFIVGSATTCAISAYHHYSCEFEPRLSVLDAICDKVCQWLATGQWFSPGNPVSYTNKTDRHEIIEILMKVALNTITITPVHCHQFSRCWRNSSFKHKKTSWLSFVQYYVFYELEIHIFQTKSKLIKGRCSSHCIFKTQAFIVIA